MTKATHSEAKHYIFTVFLCPCYVIQQINLEVGQGGDIIMCRQNIYYLNWGIRECHRVTVK